MKSIKPDWLLIRLATLLFIATLAFSFVFTDKLGQLIEPTVYAGLVFCALQLLVSLIIGVIRRNLYIIIIGAVLSCFLFFLFTLALPAGHA